MVIVNKELQEKIVENLRFNQKHGLHPRLYAKEIYELIKPHQSYFQFVGTLNILCDLNILQKSKSEVFDDHRNYKNIYYLSSTYKIAKVGL